MFSKPGIQTKIGQAMEILLIPRFWSGSTKSSLFLYLSQEIGAGEACLKWPPKGYNE